ncbi:hypothetical protein C2E23DRAFT_810040 [Lenzites betulinus]|nr:hypothetical protein C2E23DRAFT_810040 [Lenzites betulinus]
MDIGLNNIFESLAVADPGETSLSGIASGVKRHSDYWFDDGSIVVIAQDTGYKIHKSVLARHSEVFRDLFSLPQTSADDHLDGCPVVRITDASGDFSNLLRALYDTTRDFSLFQLHKRQPFAVVAGLYELAHKYQIDNLAEQMLRRLRSIFTDNLNTWDALEHVRVERGYTIVRSASLEVASRTDAIRAVNLARRSGIASMLPVAIYLTTFHRTGVLLTGIPRPDGTIDTLSHEDLVRCLDARAIFAHWTHTKFAWLTTARVDSGCKSPAVCGAALTVLSRENARGSLRPKTPYFALDIFGDAMKSLARKHGACKTCNMAMLTRAEEERRVMWRSLPQDLRLDITDWGRS